jgi:CheY-like chemotaxis protein
MLVLIVEDNAFNAFCLSRILESSIPDCHVRIAANSLDANVLIAQEQFDLIIVDGDLGASDGLHCNGPALVDLLWTESPWLNIVAWSDSSSMRQSFSDVFSRHHKPFDEQTCWPKMVGEQRVKNVILDHYPSLIQGTPLTAKLRESIK